MWRMWRVIDPRKAIVLVGLLIAFVSTSIHLIQISGDRPGAVRAAARARGVLQLLGGQRAVLGGVHGLL